MTGRTSLWVRQHRVATLLTLTVVLFAIPLLIPLLENLTPYYRTQAPIAPDVTRNSLRRVPGVQVELHRQRSFHVGESTSIQIDLVVTPNNPQGWSNADALQCDLLYNKSAFEVVDVQLPGGVAHSCLWLVVPLTAGTQKFAFNATATQQTSRRTALYQGLEEVYVWQSPLSATEVTSALGVISAALALVAALKKRDGSPDDRTLTRHDEEETPH